VASGYRPAGCTSSAAGHLLLLLLLLELLLLRLLLGKLLVLLQEEGAALLRMSELVLLLGPCRGLVVLHRRPGAHSHTCRTQQAQQNAFISTL
jgi:hypothetical protein